MPHRSSAQDAPQIDVQFVASEEGRDGASWIEGNAQRPRQEVAGAPCEHPQGAHRTRERPGHFHSRAVATEGEHSVIAGGAGQRDLGRVPGMLRERHVATDIGSLECCAGAWQSPPSQP